MATYYPGALDRLTALAGEYRFITNENGDVIGAYPADEDWLPCGCEVQCDSAHDDDSPDEPDDEDDDGRTDPSWAAEWDAVDADRTVVTAW